MALTSDKADAAFADLVYADQALVDAEFAGIVAASFGGPPAPPPAAPPGFPFGPGLPDPGYRRPAAAVAASTPMAWPPGGRQRSPPERDRADGAATAAGR